MLDFLNAAETAKRNLELGTDEPLFIANFGLQGSKYTKFVNQEKE